MRNLKRMLLALGAVLAFSGCGAPSEEPPAAPEEAVESQEAEPAAEAPAPAADEAAPAEEAPSAPVTAAPPGTPPEVNAAGKIVWRPDLWQNPPLGLPPVPDPAENRTSNEKVELGRLLYFDARLSGDGTISCASCHHPTLGFSNGQRVSPGIRGQVGSRNAPTVYNSAYAGELFWDGRAASLEDQAIGPITNPIEMGHTVGGMLEALEGIESYRPLFEAAFGTLPKITEEHVVKAIAAFERTINSGDAPYDRFKAGDQGALSEEARRGLSVFEGRGRCVLCHTGPNFTDNAYHNIGIGTQDEKPDEGRMAVTKDENDWAKFRTPTLRNSAVTGPYMHDGSIESLEKVVAHYVKGGIANRNLDPLYQALDLTEQEQADLVTFLKEGLTREIEVPVPTYGGEEAE